jgi:hypothetical protein
MQKALIEGATHNPGAPKDWDPKKDGDCGGLPIRFDGRGCRSAWKPTPEELAVLIDGGYIELYVAGWQPPVSLGVLDRNGAQELE